MHFFISFKHNFHVDVESMKVGTRGMSIISAYIFDFTARRFFVDIYRSHDKLFKAAHDHCFYSSRKNSENGLLPLWGSVVGLCFVVLYFVSILILQSS